MKRMFALLAAGLFLAGACVIFAQATAKDAEKNEITPVPPVVKNTPRVMETTDISVEEEEAEELAASQEDIELLALLTMAEAEGEPEYGQRLVIDSVLNRVDCDAFPDTIYEVIWQKNQYAGMYGERIKRCYVKEELVELVKEELANRTNDEIVYFRTGRYSDYGEPLFQIGNHYFSSYD